VQAVAEVLIPALTARFPEAPAPDLDKLLDAAAECLARHGLAKTSVPDIARELGVAPSTVYRKVGTVEQAAWLIAARETRRFADRLPDLLDGVDGARRVTVAIAAAADATRAHPVCIKILRDDPDFVGRSLTRRMPIAVDGLAATFRPFLEAAMDLGIIRRHEPAWLADWIARLYLIAVLAPPVGDVGASLDALLLPILEP